MRIRGGWVTADPYHLHVAIDWPPPSVLDSRWQCARGRADDTVFRATAGSLVWFHRTGLPHTAGPARWPIRLADGSIWRPDVPWGYAAAAEVNLAFPTAEPVVAVTVHDAAGRHAPITGVGLALSHAQWLANSIGWELAPAAVGEWLPQPRDGASPVSAVPSNTARHVSLAAMRHERGDGWERFDPAGVEHRLDAVPFHKGGWASRCTRATADGAEDTFCSAPFASKAEALAAYWQHLAGGACGSALPKDDWPASYLVWVEDGRRSATVVALADVWPSESVWQRIEREHPDVRIVRIDPWDRRRLVPRALGAEQLRVLLGDEEAEPLIAELDRLAEELKRYRRLTSKLGDALSIDQCLQRVDVRYRSRSGQIIEGRIGLPGWGLTRPQERSTR